jgi:hypothetical protein
LIVYDGSWLAAGGLRYYECLDAEAPHEKLVTLSLSIGLDVALIPSQAKRRIGNLDHKEIKLGIRWKPPYVDRHHLNRPQRDDSHVGVGVLDAIGGYGTS